MTKVLVLTVSPAGTTLTPVESVDIATKLCVYAIGHGATFAFYSR